MEMYEFYKNMNDVQLKPRLLRSLTKEHLPDENHPFPTPLQLSNVLSAIKMHGLLSESVGGGGTSVDQKLVDKWKLAVDAWVEGLLLLVSSKMLDKCWAGICLLGVTCQECSTARFLDSYSAWFQKLLLQIQQPLECQLVKVATCASLSDMFTRLSGFLSVKKDTTSLAGKLVQPILKLISEDASESVWEGAVDLFCTLTHFFPASVHRHYDSAEAVIASKIMSGKCNTNLSKKFAYCLALLPKTRGDDDSWALMMQKILIFINIQLNDAFQGLEEEIKTSEAMRLLIQPGKDPPPPLGNQLAEEASEHAPQTAERLLFYRVSTLMQCCSMMLTHPYPVQVSIPVRPLLALVRRVLSVDGSSSQALLSFMTVAQQENICSELPPLHLYSLELLTATIKGMRSQLLPNAGEVVRIISEYFRRCMLPALRIKLYSIMKILLISMGVGIAIYLAKEVINNAFVDLDSFIHGSTNASSNIHSKSATSTHTLQQVINKKRKHATLTGSTADHQNGVDAELELLASKPTTPVSVQIAALQALEALLTVGGALKSESWRPNIDFLLINVSSKSCDGGWANEETSASIVSSELSSSWSDFQLAALRALLASLLSPTHCRPQHLSRGLELFRRGKQETGTKIAEFCAHALLALEVLIHPRALPLSDFSLGNRDTFYEGLNHKFPQNPFSSSQKQNNPFLRGVLGIDEPDPDDDLYKSWIGNGEEVEVPVNNTDKNVETYDSHSEKHSQHSDDSSLTRKVVETLADQHVNGNFLIDKLAVDGPINTVDVDENKSKEASRSIYLETERSENELMVSAERCQVQIAFSDVGPSDRGPQVNSEIEFTSYRSKLDAAGDVAALEKPTTLCTTTLFGEENQILIKDDSDSDSIPDIVDADPDSDSDY